MLKKSKPPRLFSPDASAFAVRLSRLSRRSPGSARLPRAPDTLQHKFTASRWGAAGEAMLARAEDADAHRFRRIGGFIAAWLSAARVTTRADAAALLGTSQMHALHAGAAAALLGLRDPRRGSGARDP